MAKWGVKDVLAAYQKAIRPQAVGGGTPLLEQLKAKAQTLTARRPLPRR